MKKTINLLALLFLFSMCGVAQDHDRHNGHEYIPSHGPHTY